MGTAVYRETPYCKMRFWGWCSLLFVASKIAGQVGNLVPNGSFELLRPTATVTPFEVVKHWNAIDSGKAFAYYTVNLDPPLSNAPYCSLGFQYPKSGRGFIATTFYCTPNCKV